MSRFALFAPLAPLAPLASVALLIGACTNTPSASDSASSASSSALTSADTNSTALAVGQRVGVTFSAVNAGAVARVTIADPNDHGGPGGMGRGGPGGMGGPQDANHAADANRPTLDPNTAALHGQLHGAVTAVDLSSGKLTVLGVEALTDVSTQYGQVTDLSQVQVGMVVRVAGTLGNDGSFTAARIDVRPDDLQGTITAISSDTPPTITVLGRSLALSASTEVVQLIAPQHDASHGGPGDANDMHGGGRPSQQR